MVNDQVGNEKLLRLRENMNKVVVGKSEVIDLLMIALLANGHVLLEDAPGTGKTVLAKTLAKSIQGDCKRIQFTPDVLPSDVTGINFFNPKEQQFELRVGPVSTNVLLADEINRATPRTQSSLLEAMEERQITIDGETVQLPRPFFVIATQNPIESQGTFSLPEAQLDRFFMKLNVGYPTFQDEQQMLRRFKQDQPLHELEPVMELQDIEQMQKEVQRAHLSEDVEQYLLQIIHATRNHDGIEVGISPRGSLAFMRGCQAKAFLHGRNYVIPDDVKSMAKYILGHRLILTLESELHTTPADLLEQIVESIMVPLEEVGR